MNKYVELASTVAVGLYTIATAIGVAFPGTKLGLICAKFAAALSHVVSQKNAQ
jgi:hypothetical protein